MNHSLAPQRKGAKLARAGSVKERKSSRKRREEEVVQRGTPLIFLARAQKQEVGRGEPRGDGPVSSGKIGVRFGIESSPPSACPQADRVGLQISLMKPLASSPQAAKNVSSAKTVEA